MAETIERLRAFNRRWTEVLGLLGRHLLDTRFSLTEGRVLYELAQHEQLERLDLRRRLDIDASFLTRVLTRLEHQGVLDSARSPADGRRRLLRLTAAGRAAATDLDRRATDQLAERLAGLTEDQQRTLVEATSLVSTLVAPDPERTVSIRTLEPGDRGWIVQRHGAVYADEFRWADDFERLVARIVADFDGSTARRERGWIAEVDGARAGCILCCHKTDETAQLRLLLVEPWARGLGLGHRLVDECIRFARHEGYRDLVLWTNDVLTAARRIYQAAEFELVDEEPHHSFGHDLVGQHWRLALDRS